jgi:predicted short-subunit dehydrogenase-like oxidoreductase (DUF2520 family)
MAALKEKTFTVIGNGALGGAITTFLENENCLIRSVFTSKGGVIFQGEGVSDSKRVSQTYPIQESEVGDVIFICVPDDLIPAIAKQLSNVDLEWSKKSVIHCSGNLFSDELQALSQLGAQTASMHPLQTFQRGDGAGRFDGIFVSLEGHPELCKQLEGFVKSMGANSLRVQKEQKQMLHIAAVFASNYVVAILHEAEGLLREKGIENGLKPLEPLIRQTINNSLNLGPTEALTGPIARGDAESVLKHLQAFKDQSESMNLYRVLGTKALQIADERGNLATDKFQALKQILQPKKK